MRIGIFEPSSPSNKKIFETGLNLLKKGLADFRLDIKIFGILHSSNSQLPFIALKDNEKSKVFRRAILNGRDFIFLTRGGYGCLRWVDKVDWLVLSRAIKNNNILIIGFSDATFLACALLKHGCRFLHGPMICTLKETEEKSLKSLFKFLNSGELTLIKGKGFLKGNYKGQLIGGNLTCLCHTIGTWLEPEWEDKILFIEDVNEEPYKIDRMLTHLELAGVFKKIGALCIGDFMLSSSDKEIFYNIIKDKFSHFLKPIIIDLPCGHGKSNFPLLLGSEYKVSGERGILEPC